MIRRPFADDHVRLVVGVRRDADAFALTERVEVKPAMRAEFTAVRGAYNWPGRIRHVRPQEVGHLHLANETDSLTVLFLRGWKLRVARNRAEFGFGQMPDGKAR